MKFFAALCISLVFIYGAYKVITGPTPTATSSTAPAERSNRSAKDASASNEQITGKFVSSGGAKAVFEAFQHYPDVMIEQRDETTLIASVHGQRCGQLNAESSRLEWSGISVATYSDLNKALTHIIDECGTSLGGSIPLALVSMPDVEASVMCDETPCTKKDADASMADLVMRWSTAPTWLRQNCSQAEGSYTELLTCLIHGVTTPMMNAHPTTLSAWEMPETFDPEEYYRLSDFRFAAGTESVPSDDAGGDKPSPALNPAVFGTTRTSAAPATTHSEYVNAVNRKVRENWYTQEVDPTTQPGTQVVIGFTIARNGSPSNFHVVRPSGVQSLDVSAIRAAQRVDDYGPLPADYQGSSVDVEYTLTYERPGR